jgi:hypothetical protein
MYSQVLEYIKQCKELHIDDSTIFSILTGVGWKEDDIYYAFSEFNKINALPAPPIPNYDAPTHLIGSDPRAIYSQPIHIVDLDMADDEENAEDTEDENNLEYVGKENNEHVPTVGFSRLIKWSKTPKKIFSIIASFFIIGLMVGRGISLNNHTVKNNTAIDNGMVAGVVYNPQSQQNPQITNCINPQHLLQSNLRCSENEGNCGKAIIAQDINLASVGISNTKDKIAQTFVFPTAEKNSELTEVAPFIMSFYGNLGCMSIYEQSDVTQPQSGRLLAEYSIDFTKLKAESFNSFFINPIPINPSKSYSVVFSLLNNESFMSFAKGNELSNYNNGTAYYLKSPLENCSALDCPIVEWVSRQDDLKFKLKFF